MADVKVGEAYIAGCKIVDFGGVAATGLEPTSILLKLSDGARTTPAVTEVSDGVYKATVTSDAEDTWILTFVVDGNYNIYGAVHEIKVGGGNVKDIEDVVGALTDVADQDADATTKTIIALIKGILDVLWDADGIAAYPVALKAANGVSMAEVVRYISDEQIGEEFDGSPDVYDVLVTGYDSSVLTGDIDGSIPEILKAMAGGTYTSESLVAIYTLLDAILDLTETGDTITSDGSEQDVYLNNAPSGVFEPRVAFVDLTNMQDAEEVVIREYYRIKSGGNLILLDEVTYIGVQALPLIQVLLKPNRYGVWVSLEMTVGGPRTYDVGAFYNG